MFLDSWRGFNSYPRLVLCYWSNLFPLLYVSMWFCALCRTRETFVNKLQRSASQGLIMQSKISGYPTAFVQVSHNDFLNVGNVFE